MDKRRIVKKIIAISLLLLAGLFLYIYYSVFMPIILALFTALLVEPLVKLVQKYLKTEKRLPAVTVIFTLFLASISLALYFAITKLINETIKFTTRLPYYMVEISLFIDRIIEDFNEAIADIPQKHLIIQELENQSQMIVDKTYSIAQNAIPVLASWIQAIPNMLILLLVYLITLFLISLDLPRLISGFYQLFEEEKSKKLQYVFNKLGKVFTGFFKAQFLVSIVIFIFAYLGLLFIVPKHALLMAIVIWIIDVIPFIGSIVILAPWAIYAFIIGNIAMGINLVILALVLLTLRRTLEPKVMGDQIGLPALPTLLSIYFGLYFLGVAGLVLGPLLVIAIKSAIEAGLIKINLKPDKK